MCPLCSFSYIYFSSLPFDQLVAAVSLLEPWKERSGESRELGELATKTERAEMESCKEFHEIGTAPTDTLLPESAVEEADSQDFVNYFPGELVSHPLSCSEELYHCYSIGFDRKFEYDLPFRDITLLLRSNLDSDFANIDFELDGSRGSVIVNIVYAGTIHLSPEQVLMARRFQITVLRVLIDHNLDKLKDSLNGLHHQQETLPRVDYLLLPSVGCNQKSSLIDWECVRSALFENVGGNHRHCCESFSVMHTKDGVVCRCMLVNSLVSTPYNGYLYCITGTLDDLDGNSFLKLKRGGVLTYKEYYKDRHGINLRYEGESLLSGRHIFPVQNWLQRHKDHKEKESSNACVELVPELCVIIMSPISASTFYSFSLLPSIMHRLESTLLAISLKKMQLDHCTQNVTIPTIKVLEAITTKNCQEEFSLESLETLGDSFLKYAVSQQLFRTNKDHREGLLTAEREKLVSNSALCKLGCDRKLQGFIRYACFDPKKWVIPGDNSSSFVLDEILLFNPGKIYVTGTRLMKSKVVADLVEALIGAYLSTGGESAALLFMDWLGMKVGFDNEIPNERFFLVQPEKHVNICDLESVLSYPFRDPSLLVEAVTHGSYQHPDIPRCYQRLEFLGDSVLDYLVTIYMYNKYPGMSPGLLTDLRSASVNNDCYAHAAVKAGLHKYILRASSKLENQITFFVNNVEQSSREATNGWESETDVPKVLGDIIESLAGAILIDSGYNKDTVWECMRPLLEPMATPDTMKLHPVSELICQGKSYEYRTSTSCTDGVTSIKVEVVVDGISYRHTFTGVNKKTAKKLAHKLVLESLKASIPKL